MSLLESLCVSYAEIKSLLPLSALQKLWNDVLRLLTPNTEDAYLAVFLHLGSVMLENLQTDALFLVEDLMKILPCTLEKQNETCRAESCRCLGWLCCVFPVVGEWVWG